MDRVAEGRLNGDAFRVDGDELGLHRCDRNRGEGQATERDSVKLDMEPSRRSLLAWPVSVNRRDFPLMFLAFVVVKPHHQASQRLWTVEPRELETSQWFSEKLHA